MYHTTSTLYAIDGTGALFLKFRQTSLLLLLFVLEFKYNL